MFILFVILFCIAIFYWQKWQHSYWKRRGIAQVKPDFFFGNAKDVILNKVPLGRVLLNICDDFKRKKEKHGGIYLLHQPKWVPIDLDLIKQIMTSDYEYFDSHGVFFHEKDPITINIFNLHGERWRSLRSKLTPTFTSVKLKMMFDTINILGKRIETNLSNSVKNHQPLDMEEIAACFGIDVVATCFFGLESDCMNNPESEFRKNGRIIFRGRGIKVFLEMLINWDLLTFFGYSFCPKKVIEFFTNVVHDTVAHRENNNISRKDYLDLLIQLKNKGKVDDAEDIIENQRNDKENGFLTFQEVVANVALMFTAGFETTSGTTSFLLYELAKHQDIQEKARMEILNILGNRSSDDLTYKDLNEMKYCEMCISETLRLYPPGTVISRICTKQYQIPGTEKIIEKGTAIFIPTLFIHTDPEFYPNPWIFNPENFNSENKNTRPDFAFLSFGGGPRQCLGYRFAYMQMKIVMVRFLRYFKYTLNAKTPEKLHFTNANSHTLKSVEDLLLDVTRL